MRAIRITAHLLTGTLLLAGGAAQAALVNYTSSGVNLVYDQDRNLTWVADANLFRTQYVADNSVVSKISTAVPTVAGHTIVVGDFATSTGVMTWWGATAWTQWLGSIGYGGASDWRLPATPQPDATCGDQYDPGGGLPLQGYGYNCTGSDLGHLFYTEGQLTAGQSILADPPGILDNHFANMQSSVYWSGTQFAPDPYFAWFFTDDGYQSRDDRGSQFYGWAVRPGQVAAAPLPATGLLMALGLLALGATRHGRRATLVIW